MGPTIRLTMSPITRMAFSCIEQWFSKVNMDPDEFENSILKRLLESLPLLSSSRFAENKDKPHSCSTVSFQTNISLRASMSLPAITKANFLRLAPRKF